MAGAGVDVDPGFRLKHPVCASKIARWRVTEYSENVVKIPFIRLRPMPKQFVSSIFVDLFFEGKTTQPGMNQQEILLFCTYALIQRRFPQIRAQAPEAPGDQGKA